MMYPKDVPITIVGAHGRNLARHLKQYLTKKGLRAYVVGAIDLKRTIPARRIRNCSTLICINKDIQSEVEEHFEVEEKHLICLDVHEYPENASAKAMSGESWVEYQETTARPAIEKQIQKHLKVLLA